MNISTYLRRTMSLHSPTTLWLLATFILSSNPAFAARFANQFVEFELPAKWQCTLEGAEWVCQSVDQDKKRDAIIVLAAKLRGDQDSIDKYRDYLAQPKTFQNVQGRPMKSESKYSRTSSLNDHPWVDSLHFESELPGFYTRYLATIKEDIGVLVTYSISKAKYQAMQGEFDSMAKTLKVFRKGGGLNAAPAGSNLFSNTTIPKELTQGSIFPEMGAPGGSTSEQKPARADGGDDMLIYVGLGAAVVLFILWRRRRSG